MDEPLSNLDAVLRESMRGELKALFRRLQATVIYVTHDQAEAMSLSDSILVMGQGRVRQCAPPLDLYARPADLFTATFVGSPRMTVWRGRRGQGVLEARGVAVPLPAGLAAGPELYVGVRPEDVELAEEPLEGGWAGAVQISEPTGDRVLLTIRVGDETLRAFGALRPWPEKLWVRFPPDKLHWFDAGTEKRVG
jgi:multiple sugar transport system ATP-binding protein